MLKFNKLRAEDLEIGTTVYQQYPVEKVEKQEDGNYKVTYTLQTGILRIKTPLEAALHQRHVDALFKESAPKVKIGENKYRVSHSEIVAPNYTYDVISK